jgi:hypothetical protein
LVAVLLLASGALGQEAIPQGTIIPVALNGTLSSNRAKPNRVISARVMQDVPLPDDKQIRQGARVTGHVVEVRPGAQGSGSMISFVFDRLATSKMALPVITDLRAMASVTAVESAQIPAFGMGEGDSWSARTTVQVGGDTVYWGGGPVASAAGRVGKPLVGADSGVLVRVTANPKGGCRGDSDENQRVQALWVFSSNACGVYGLNGLTISRAGRTEPSGVIELASRADQVKVPSGTGMLLRVIGPRE